MEAYLKYSAHLEGLIESSVLAAETASGSDKRSLLKDASSELRKLVPLNDLRSSGAFFTSSVLSQFALQSILETIDENSVILDPTCGAGDLLLACTSKFPICNNLTDTLKYWGDRLLGIDLHPEFIDVAKKRLVLAAIERGTDVSSLKIKHLENAFSKIRAGSAYKNCNTYRKVTHILINPPYNSVSAAPDCEWASGKINSAAVFMEFCVKSALGGTEVAAILPDVLRSGSRYGKWRALIQKYANVKRVLTYGQFDRETDVDVFILQLEIRQQPLVGQAQSSDWAAAPKGATSISDMFSVSVGPLVDYREPRKGGWRPFIVSRGLPQWAEVSDFPNRRFRGKSIEPPFVVVRRTSRPNDRYRVIGTIVRGKKLVAVENHLIILKPLDNKLKTCRLLLRNLKDARTSRWMDQRIRCRHLTVSSLKDLPWWG